LLNRYNNRYREQLLKTLIQKKKMSERNSLSHFTCSSRKLLC